MSVLTDTQNSTAYAMGRTARAYDGLNGRARLTNPFAGGTQAHLDWLQGWRDESEAVFAESIDGQGWRV